LKKDSFTNFLTLKLMNFLRFIKYNNAFLIILGIVFLAAGSSFASEKVRDTVIGQTIEEVKGVDNSALLAINLDSLKQEMSIADVAEDEDNYLVSYAFSTFDIKDNIWQNQTKTQTLKVPKDALKGGKDLGLYVQSELAQIMDNQLAYLKDAKEKEQKKGETKIVKTTKYTGLKGLVLNSETKELEGYEPVIKKEERKDPPYVQFTPQSAGPAAVAEAVTSSLSSSSPLPSEQVSSSSLSFDATSGSSDESSSSSNSPDDSDSSDSTFQVEDNQAGLSSSSLSSSSQNSSTSDSSAASSAGSGSEEVSSSSSSEAVSSSSSELSSSSVESSETAGSSSSTRSASSSSSEPANSSSAVSSSDSSPEASSSSESSSSSSDSSSSSSSSE